MELKRKADWDNTHKRIRSSEPNAESWQKELDDLYNKAKRILKELENEGIASSDKIIEQLRYGTKSESFLIFAEEKVPGT